MLSRIVVRRTLAAFGLTIGIVSGIYAVPIKASADGINCGGNGICTITLSTPPTDPSYNLTTGSTPANTTCYVKVGADLTTYQSLACSTDKGWWSNVQQCYFTADTENLAPPPGKTTNDGAWYVCYKPISEYVSSVFLSNPPPGLSMSSATAAAMVMKTMTFDPITIDMAPQVNTHLGYRRSFVGVPIWMWVPNRTEHNWGPYTVSATLGGQTITATAKVTGVLWNMGDGNTVACGQEGTVYNTGYGVTDSPTCGYRYSITSKTHGGFYTVTATSLWTISWSASSGASGTLNTTGVATDQLWIDELQAVNVPVTQ